MKRKAKKSPEEIKRILAKVIKKIGTKKPGTKENILDAWRNAAGENAAAHSRPISIKKKVLVIEVDSSTWLYSLNLTKRALIKGLKKQLGDNEISDIRLRMGEIT